MVRRAFAFVSLLGLCDALGGGSDDSAFIQVKQDGSFAYLQKSGARGGAADLKMEAFCQDLNVDPTSPNCTTHFDLASCKAIAEQNCKAQSSKCTWKSAQPPKFLQDYCVVKEGLGEQPEVVDGKLPPLFYFPRYLLSREFIYTDVGPENGKPKVAYYRLVIALQEGQSLKDLGVDPGLEDYLRVAPGTGKGTLLDCSNSPDAKQCTGTYPCAPEFRHNTYPGQEFGFNKSGTPYAGRAYSPVSDFNQKGSVEFIFEMSPGDSENSIGMSIYASLLPVGSEVLMTKRPMEQDVRVYSDYPEGYYDLSRELNPVAALGGTTDYTLNVIVAGTGLTAAAVVSLTELLEDPGYATVTKVNILWAVSYYSYVEWVYTQNKTNDLVRTFFKEQGKYGARFNQSVIISRETVAEASYEGYIDKDVISEAFDLQPGNVTRGPGILWQVVGSQNFVDDMLGIVREDFGFDVQCYRYGKDQPDEAGFTALGVPETGAGVFVMGTGSHYIYNSVPWFSDLNERKPSRMMRRFCPDAHTLGECMEAPTTNTYVVESQCPALGCEFGCEPNAKFGNSRWVVQGNKSCR